MYLIGSFENLFDIEVNQTRIFEIPFNYCWVNSELVVF